MAAFEGSHCRIGELGFAVHWMEPNRIAIKTGDPQITRPDGSKPGIWVSASSDPDSANYDPSSFNRWAGILRDHDQAAPDPVPEHSRRLDHKWPLPSPGRREKRRRWAARKATRNELPVTSAAGLLAQDRCPATLLEARGRGGDVVA